MLTPLCLFLAAAVSYAVLKSRSQEVPMPRFAPITAHIRPSWHPNVPLTECYESVTVIPGTLKPTPDTDHYARLEALGLRELRASRDGQTIERRTFPA